MAATHNSSDSSKDARYVFVAFAASPSWLFDTISSAIENANASQSQFTFHGWPANDIPGRPLTGPIRSGIYRSSFVVADISTLNLNVTYEVGFAIGTNRRAYLIKNRQYQQKPDITDKVGVFDTLGYQPYDNSNSLSQALSSVRDLVPLNTNQPLDPKAPIYILETPQKGDTMIHIVSCVKEARFQYRSFNPSEDARLSASDAISHVSGSHGVVVPLLPDDIYDSAIHNVRAAFIAGLAHGMEKPTLILKPIGFDAPLDLRDSVKEYVRLDDINSHINQLSLDVIESM